MAEQLLSTLKGIKPTVGTPAAPVIPVSGSERPVNNISTRPNTYQADLAKGQNQAVINNQINQANNAKVRDPVKEADTAKKIGGQPKNASEFWQAQLMTYGADGLKQMGLGEAAVNAINGGTNPNNPVAQAPDFDPTTLKASGFSDAQINALAGLGGDVNAAQIQSQATPQPTNTMLGVLQSALKASSGVGSQGQNLGKSDLFGQAGVVTTGALGYGALAQSLAQRRQEMGQKYDSYANTIQQVGGQMSDDFNKKLKLYEDTTKRYDKAVSDIQQINKDAADHQERLDLATQQFENSKKLAELDRQYENNKMQFVPETDNQGSGYFNPKTGEFTPLSVGGNSYSNNSGGSYLGDGIVGNGSALSYNTPVPHGSANVTVTESNPNLINAYENGFKKAAGATGFGGQCAYEAEQLTTLGGKGWSVGNSIQDKAKSFDNYAKQGLGFYKGQGEPQVGNAVFSNDDPEFGHIWLINAKTDDGKLVASEFNRAGTRVFSNNRVVDPNDKSIIGFLKTEPKPDYQVKAENTAAANITKAVEGVKQIAKGKVQGGLLDLLQASTMVAKDFLLDSGKQSLSAKAQVEAQAKVAEGQKQGLLDERGLPYSPERAAIRSGVYSDTMLGQKYSELSKAVKKGTEPQEALSAFQNDLMYGKQKAQEITAKQSLDTKLSQPMNEAQGKAIGFAVSAHQAEGFMPKEGTDKTLAGLNNWFNRAGKNDDIVSDKINEIKDPVGRQLANAEMQWVANVLRGESGAAISLGEYKNAGMTYFPRPGDTTAILEQKKKAREQKVDNLLVQGGPQGAQYWLNSGYELPNAVAKQYGIEAPKKDTLGLFGAGEDPLGLFN